MTQEKITLTTGEVLIVERNSNYSSNHYICLWLADKMKPSERIATASKGWTGQGGIPYWEQATISGGSYSCTPAELPRFYEILQHAARLAAELDEQYRPGTESP